MCRRLVQLGLQASCSQAYSLECDGAVQPGGPGPELYVLSVPRNQPLTCEGPSVRFVF
jgi:hypothetical protein